MALKVLTLMAKHTTRRVPSFYGLNRRVAKKLLVSDALVSMVSAGLVADKHGILDALRVERARMRAEHARKLHSNQPNAVLGGLDPRQPSAGRTNIDADTVG